MKQAEFLSWLEQAKRLTKDQQRKAAALLSVRLHDPRVPSSDVPQSLEPELERALETEDPKCPACGGTRLYRWGRRKGIQRFKCRACGHAFNGLSGTSLAGLHKREKWLAYADCLEQGLTLRQSAKVCGVDFKTAFRWRHRFMSGVSEDQAEDLGGIVEADETFFRESRKGKRRLPRPPRKRGTPASQRGRSKEWLKAVTLRDRSGATHELVLADFKASELLSEVAFQIRPDAVLCTDGSPVYRKLAKALDLEHKPIITGKAGRIRGAFHIQNVNAYHSRLKQWIARFHGVGTYYLPNYLGWHRLLDGHRETLTPTKLLRVALGREHFQPITPS